MVPLNIRVTTRRFPSLGRIISVSSAHSRIPGVIALLRISLIVWFDVTEDSEVVPKFDGLIFVKATRLPASAVSKKSDPSVKKPASRPKPAKQEPKNEPVEDFLQPVLFILEDLTVGNSVLYARIRGAPTARD